MEKITLEELTAAYVNAPKGFWHDMAEEEKDPGDDNLVSASIMLEFIMNEDGIKLTSDSTQTADIILQHRIRMAQVPQELPVPVYVLYEALHSVASHNATVTGLSLLYCDENGQDTRLFLEEDRRAPERSARARTATGPWGCPASSESTP